MRIAVVYSTMTGNSRRIAESVATALETKAVDIKAKPVLNEVDLLFIVGGIYGGESSPELKAFVEGIQKGNVNQVALITSCLSRKQKQDGIRQTLVSNGIDVLAEEFICKGRFLFLGFGHPNSDDMRAAVSFTKEVMAKRS